MSSTSGSMQQVRQVVPLGKSRPEILHAPRLQGHSDASRHDKSTIGDYAAAARNAKAAGFDGVELHSATTYLLPEFLNSALNVRQDEYGGGSENRARIVIEILEALIGVWGPGRVGVKISPTMAINPLLGYFVTQRATILLRIDWLSGWNGALLC
jgi:hypothetical protein